MIAQRLVKLILPMACRWAEAQEGRILENGVPLDHVQLSDAELAGVRCKERIRVAYVDRIPFPLNPLVRRVAERMGMMSPRIAGLTLRYGIYIRSDRSRDRGLLVHEFVHTRQYEVYGGFGPFLESYLHECITVGYPLGPMEQEARRVESTLVRACMGGGV
jgi:hypothetical protein